jgi:hypothetical protein
MADSARQETALKRIAMVIATETIGGHEFQSRVLADDLAKLCRLTVYLNREELQSVFGSAGAQVEVHPGLFLTKGWLGKQVLRGLTRKKRIRALLGSHDHIIVCGGTIEAGVCTSIALAGTGKAILYLPFFYDRTIVWGKPLGCAYNLILSCFGLLYNCVITINRIQAHLVHGFLHRPTLIIPNLTAELPRATRDAPGRVLCICRLGRQKRLLELLRWLDFAENPFQEVLMIGDGPERIEIIRLSASLQHIQVKVLGWKWPSEQDELIGAHDVLILNSAIEGEPLVIREANKRGILVLARDIPGVRGVTKRANRFRNEMELRRALRKLPEIIPISPPSQNRRERLVRLAFDSITKTPGAGRISGYPA